jgi:hypothetical protein
LLLQSLGVRSFWSVVVVRFQLALRSGWILRVIMVVVYVAGDYGISGGMKRPAGLWLTSWHRSYVRFNSYRRKPGFLGVWRGAFSTLGGIQTAARCGSSQLPLKSTAAGTLRIVISMLRYGNKGRDIVEAFPGRVSEL